MLRLFRWLTAEHPDPSSFECWHMRAVLSFFRTGMSWTELAILAWHGGEYRTPQALFWDYASLYQWPRTAEEE